MGLARDRFGLEAGSTKLLGEVVGVLDAGRVDDARSRPESLAVETRRGLVERRVVECCGERALLEVAADDRHRVDRSRRRDPQAAQRRDQPSTRGVREGEIVDRGGEDVRDLLRDQLLGRGHADVDRLAEGADRRARLLAEGGVRLVADHELVGAPRDLVGVAGEPGVGLDRDRVVPEWLLAGVDRVREAVGVPLRRQVALELGDEEPAVREDQDPEVPRRFDEACSGDRLAGGRRVAEAIAALRARILSGERRLVGVEVDDARVEVVVLLVQLARVVGGLGASSSPLPLPFSSALR